MKRSAVKYWKWIYRDTGKREVYTDCGAHYILFFTGDGVTQQWSEPSVPGIEPGLAACKANALTTQPSLRPENRFWFDFSGAPGSALRGCSSWSLCVVTKLDPSHCTKANALETPRTYLRKKPGVIRVQLCLPNVIILKYFLKNSIFSYNVDYFFGLRCFLPIAKGF